MFRLPLWGSELPKWWGSQANGIFVAVFVAVIPVAPALSQERHAHSSPAAQVSAEAPASVVKWTSYPALVPAGRGERGAAVLASINSKAHVLSVVFPDISKSRADFPLAGKSWSIRQPDAWRTARLGLWSGANAGADSRTGKFWASPAAGMELECSLGTSRGCHCSVAARQRTA